MIIYKKEREEEVKRDFTFILHILPVFELLITSTYKLQVGEVSSSQSTKASLLRKPKDQIK